MICKTVNNRGQILKYLRHLLFGILAIRDKVSNYKELNSGGETTLENEPSQIPG